MHQFIKTVGLTLANCAALVCAYLAFYLSFWCANLLEAALPFVISVLFCAFQPWLIAVGALCSVGLCCMTHPPQGVFVLCGTFVLTLLSSLITRRIYLTLYLQGKLTRVLRCQTRIKAGAMAFLGVALLLSYAGYKDLPKQNATPNTKSFSPLGRFSNGNSDNTITNLHFYVLPFTDNTETLWQAHVPRAQMMHFEDYTGMHRISEGTFSRRFWDKPPYWWRRPQGEIQAYAHYGFSEDGIKDGGHSEAAVYDPQTETLFLWEQWIE